ncbi:MAG: F0F1 ATP synthase subunit gamma [Candidatus Omnitrophica bacterium]|nr:F0F1 ATP synthase subunit gamma [Candidatus Omnitrophota bacterium]
MPTSKAIKEILMFLQGMQRLVAGLKDIDSSHFQRFFKQKIDKFSGFDEIIKGYLSLVHSIADVIGFEDPLLKSKSGTACIIVFTSDASFMGKLNTTICKSAMDLLREKRNAELVVIGKKGLTKLMFADARITSFPAITEQHRYEQTMKLKDYVLKQRLDGKIGDLFLTFSRCASFTKQLVETIRLLPAIDLFKEKVKLNMEAWQEICIESDISAITKYLVDIWIGRILFEAAYESKLAEYAARTSQLEGSLEYLNGEVRRMTLSYNKARQSETDTAMREVFAAILGSAV